MVVFFGRDEYEGLDGNYRFGEDNILRDGDGDIIKIRDLNVLVASSAKAAGSPDASTAPAKRARCESRPTRARRKVPKADNRETMDAPTKDSSANASFAGKNPISLPRKTDGAAINSAHTTRAALGATTGMSPSFEKRGSRPATTPSVFSAKTRQIKTSPAAVIDLTAVLTTAPVTKSPKPQQPVAARRQTSLLSLWNKKV